MPFKKYGILFKKKAMGFINYIWKCLIGYKVPLWLTIAGAFAAAMITNHYAPILAGKLEQEKFRASYIATEFKSINSLTSEYSGILIEIAEKKQKGEGIVEASLMGKEAKVATQLQWAAVNISMLLDSIEDKASIENYQAKLNDVRDKLRLPYEEFDRIDFEEALLLFIDSSIVLGEVLAKLAKLKL